MRSTRALLAALVLASVAGCIDVEDEFACASDDQCLDGSVQGACEATGYCSFPDSACPGPGPQRSFAEHSGERSGTCVGRTFHVATTGDDANPGNESAPFRTIAHGATVLLAGDALIVHEGTYAEALGQEIPAGDSWNTPVTIAARAGDAVTIVAPSADARPLTLEGEEQRYIVVTGFRIDAEGSGLEPILIGADHVRIRDCEIVNAQRQAIRVHDGNYEKTFVELIGLHIHDNGLGIPTSMEPGAPGGIDTSSSDNLIERCWLHHNYGVAIELYTGEEPGPDPTRSTDRTVIRSNRIHNHDGGMIISGGARVLVYNNLVYRGGTAIDVWWQSTDVRVFNNTIYDLPLADAAGIRLHESASNTVVRNNIVYLPNPQDAALEDNAPGTTAENNSLSDDPRFVDPDGEDFHLLPGSPAIDSGATLPEVPDDFDGVPRPQGSKYDIGAFEAR